jgi:hypothetical protein
VGTCFRAGHYRYVTAETPPPVQAAGDTIPKGLRAISAEAFFFSLGRSGQLLNCPAMDC